MKKYIGLIAILFLIPSLGIAGDEIINGVLQEAGGSSEWTGTTTITPTTATSVVAGYTSNVTTGVFQFGTQAAIGATYSPVTGGGRIGIGTTAPSEAAQISGTVLIGGDGVPGASKYRLKFGTGGTVWMNETYADILSIGASSAEWYIGTTTGVKGITGNAASGAMLINETPSDTNPGFGFQGDPDTGMGRSSANVLHLIAGGETIYTGTTTATSIGNAYSVNVDATNHALVVDQYGQVGQDPCTIEAKADLGIITDEQAAALFDQLRPFIGEYRKREPVFETKTVIDEDGKEKQVTSQTGWKYIKEGSGVIEPMMYATEMPLLNGKRLPYKDRVLIAILAAKIRVMEKTQADILNRLEALEAK